MTDPSTDSAESTLPEGLRANAPVSYFPPTSRNWAYPNTSLILHLGTMLKHGEVMLLDLPSQQFRDKKAPGFPPVAVASNAAAGHPLHQQRKNNPKANSSGRGWACVW